MSTTSIPKLAREVAEQFHRIEREAPGIGKVLARKNHDSDHDWINDLCHKAHGDMLPDDWRYEFIGDALDCIAESDDGDDIAELQDRFREFFDGRYVYTHEQTAWLASHIERPGYCDEAADDYGGKDVDMTTRLMFGMLREAEEVFASVLESLRAHADEMETEAAS